MQIIGIDPETADVPLRAVRVLLAGGVVAFPTDTYYALGAVVWNSEAVARVVAAKRRPAGDPLSALVADRDQWRAVAASLPDGALRLADRFWPGALTIVCRRRAPPAARADRRRRHDRRPPAAVGRGDGPVPRGGRAPHRHQREHTRPSGADHRGGSGTRPRVRRRSDPRRRPVPGRAAVDRGGSHRDAAPHRPCGRGQRGRHSRGARARPSRG